VIPATREKGRLRRFEDIDGSRMDIALVPSSIQSVHRYKADQDSTDFFSDDFIKDG
jgi:hypothetical protein